MKCWQVALPAALGGGLLALAGIGLAALRGGIGTRPEPSRLEVSVARALRHMAIPADERARRNPVAVTAEVLADARAHFADHCATCHANDGSGETSIGQGLRPRAPDMRLPETQRLGDGELFYFIENGVRFTGMPAWGTAGKEAETWKLVHFIRHLPLLAPEEKLEMERLNPRGPDEWRELEQEERFLQGDDAPETVGPARHHGH